MEKTVSVRLRLIHDQYMKATQEAGKATANVAKADKWQQLGKETAALGDKLTRNVTLPIVAVGAAATKMALDFDSVFVQMQSLAGVAADEIDGMKKSVLDLAGQTGKAPRELAEALYFLRSSGLDASSAMDALEMSAKASAAGMGSTVDIADAVSSAMNAYAKSGLSAAEATDVLVATAKEGKAEPAELAKQMGRLLPLSSELGISFQDVGAALASLSLSGNDAAGASTLLSNIMSKLLKPSQQAMEIMDGVGISLGDIRSMITEKGLLGTLETLRASLGDAGFTRFLEDAQAVQGGLALTGENVEKNREIFDSLNDSVGATNKAFETWGESMGAKNAKAWGQFQAALIQLGDTLAPIATEVIGFAAKILEAFSNLPGPVRTALLVFVAFAAAAGPLLSIGGRLVQAWSAFAKVWSAAATWAAGGRAFADAMNQGNTAMQGMSSSGSKLKSVLGAAGVVGAVAAVVFSVKELAEANRQRQIEETAEQFAALGDASDKATVPMIKMLSVFGHIDDVFNKLLDSNATAAARFIEAAEAAGVEKDAIAEMEKELRKKSAADKQSAEDAETNNRVTEEGAEAFDAETTAINDTVTALEGYSDTLKAMFDPLFGMVDALVANRDAQQAITDAQGALNDAVKEHGSNSTEAAEAQRELDAAMLDAGKTALDVTQATSELNAAIAENPGLLSEAKGMLGQWVAQGLITQQQAAFIGAAFDRTAAKARTLGETDPTVNVAVTGVGEAFFNIKAIQDRINAMHGRDVHIRIVGTSVGVAIPGGGLRAAGGPVYKGQGYVVGEKGPEWFEPDVSGRIVPNHLLTSNLVPHGAFAGGGGGGTVVQVSMAGAIIASSAQAQAWVTDAWNKAVRSGAGVNIRSDAVVR